MRPRSSPPLWFSILVAVAAAAALRVASHVYGPGDAGAGDAPPVVYGFFGFLILIGSLIWKGIEIAGKVTLAALKWVVVNLSLVVTKLRNGLTALGGELLHALKRAWDFTRLLYDDVLKPAWEHFWRIFDKFRAWLDSTFGPVLEWLRELRDNVLTFYRNYVRPWLDLIDVTRRVVRVLAALHVPFARELDRRLGRIEELIDKPFRLVLSKINEVINAVNRIMTLDGLIQRVALIRSLERDARYAWRAATNWRHQDLTDEERTEQRKRTAGSTPAEIGRDIGKAATGVTWQYSAVSAEMAAEWRRILERR